MLDRIIQQFNQVGTPAFSMVNYLIVLALSLVFGLWMRLIYRNYYLSNEAVEASLARSFPIMSPAVTTIFWLIQFSLPLSLGLLGALSFVRFRTPIKRAEDIAFVLLLISGSLACAVQQLAVTLSLAVLMSFYGAFRNQFVSLDEARSRTGIINVNTQADVRVEQVVEAARKVDPKAECISESYHDGITSIIIRLPKLSEKNQSSILAAMKELDTDARIDLFLPSSHYG